MFHSNDSRPGSTGVGRLSNPMPKNENTLSLQTMWGNCRAAVRVHLLRCRSRSYRLSRSERRACAEWPEWPEFSCNASRSVQHLRQNSTDLAGYSRSAVRALALRRAAPAPEAVSEISEFSSPLSQNTPPPSSLLRSGDIASVLSEDESCDAPCWQSPSALSRSAG